MNRRVLAAVLALAAVAGIAANQAYAKGGPAVARIASPIDSTTPPGSRVTVVWTLSFRDVDGKRQLIGANDVFIRLFGSGDAHSRRVFARSTRIGWYRANVTVPRGGVKRIVIGLIETTCAGLGCHRSPVFIRIVGHPLRDR